MFYDGKGRRGELVEKVGDPWHKQTIIDFFGEEKMKTWEDNRMVKLDFISSQNCIFGAYVNKINTFVFWCMVIILGPHFRLHLVRGPKAL